MEGNSELLLRKFISVQNSNSGLLVPKRNHFYILLLLQFTQEAFMKRCYVSLQFIRNRDIK